VRSYDAHLGNVTAVGFQCDAKWMFTGSEDKTIKIWDLRTQRAQRQYTCTAGVRAAGAVATKRVSRQALLSSKATPPRPFPMPPLA